MFELLRQPDGPQVLNRPPHIEYHRIFDTLQQTGGYHFLHGVATEEWQGRLAACFGFNEKDENSITEQLCLTWSDDGGRTWSRPDVISSPHHANSHSVFLPAADGLWCFVPRFLGLGPRPATRKNHLTLHFIDLQMEAFRLEGEKWQSLGIVADDFWPLSAPVKMENGNWLISGCDSKWLAAVAISRGDDLTCWDVARPDTDGEVFTEAAAWIQGSQVMLVMRNESVRTGDRFHAAVALSHDYGRTFGPCRISNLPMATSKPFCGMLSDGRPYMVFNDSIPGIPWERSRMLLGLGEKGSLALTRLYVLDEGYLFSDRRVALSYPYAREIGGRLFITYSSESRPATGYNHNDAMLAIVDLASLG